MAGLAPYLVILWIGVAVVLFARLAKPVAVIAVCLVGTLFLPEVQTSPTPPVKVHSLRVSPLDFSKTNVMSYGLLAGWLLVDGGRLRTFRPSRYDLPALAVSLVPACSAVINGNPPQMIFDEFNTGALTWGVPYLIGRVYLSDVTGCWRVTAAIALGGIVYALPCAIEMTFGPHLHYGLFGFYQHDIAQTYRYGGYRPMVFMQHGLAVALFMASAALCLWWLWRNGGWPFLQLPRVLRQTPGLCVTLVTAVAALCKSLGAAALGVAGFVTLGLSPRFRTRLLLLLLAAIPPAYVVGRVAGYLRAADLERYVGTSVETERSESLAFRLKSEEKLMAGLGDRWRYGVGGEVRGWPEDDKGKRIIPDGLWIITYYDSGAVGVAALLLFLLTPVVRFAVLHDPRTWRTSAVAPAAVAAVVIALFTIDCLFNAMVNPVYVLLAAALTGWNELTAAGRV